MKKLILSLLIPLLIIGCEQKKEPEMIATSDSEEIASAFSGKGKQIEVYTTASNTDLRLTKTENLQFTAARQPLESEISIFINPNKTFQKLLGIGGAITDASAEVFAKLPEEKQQEFLKAYYDPVDGIGYSLTRTTIHSCDFSSESYTYIEDNDKDAGNLQY